MATFVFQRGKVYWFRYRWPAGIDANHPEGYLERFTLGTRDEDAALTEAQLLAADRQSYIRYVRALQRAKMIWPKATLKREVGSYPPDADGVFVIATEKSIIRMRLGPNNSLEKIDEEDNKSQPDRDAPIRCQFLTKQEELAARAHRDRTRLYTPHRQRPVADDGEIIYDATPAYRYPEPFVASDLNQKSAKYDSDKELVAHYFRRRNIEEDVQKLTLKVLKDFYEVTGRSLAKARPEDGEKLADYYDSQTNKRKNPDGTSKPISMGTTISKIGRLRAVWNECQDKFDLPERNPFHNCWAVRNDSECRDPLSDADMAKVRAHLHNLRPELQFAWKFLACTGMRGSELTGLYTEFEENGLRCIYIAKPHRIIARQRQGVRKGKTPQSERLIPIPRIVLDDPWMPSKIDGPLLLNYSAKTLSNDLNAMLELVGVKTAENPKVVYGLRHRAADRLRAQGVIGEHKDAILGHNKKTVSDNYGCGFPMTMLEPWVNGIGY